MANYVVSSNDIIDAACTNDGKVCEKCGGDATGGNATISYSYTNFNELTVLHSGDPALAQHGGTMNYSPNQSGILGL